MLPLEIENIILDMFYYEKQKRMMKQCLFFIKWDYRHHYKRYQIMRKDETLIHSKCCYCERYPDCMFCQNTRIRKGIDFNNINLL